MFKANIHNQYIAVGSPLELWAKGALTRVYGPDENAVWASFKKNPVDGELVIKDLQP